MTSITSATGAPYWSSFRPVQYESGESAVSRVISSVKARVLSVADDEDIVLDDDMPTWVATALREINRLEQLEADWDSYGAVPISRRFTRQALSFLSRVMSDDVSNPDFVPLADGGIQLEWRLPGIELDLICDTETGQPTLLVTVDDETVEYPGGLGIDHFNACLRVPLSKAREVTAA